jgi:hypothetical protein
MSIASSEGISSGVDVGWTATLGFRLKVLMPVFVFGMDPWEPEWFVGGRGAGTANESESKMGGLLVGVDFAMVSFASFSRRASATLRSLQGFSDG